MKPFRPKNMTNKEKNGDKLDKCLIAPFFPISKLFSSKK